MEFMLDFRGGVHNPWLKAQVPLIQHGESWYLNEISSNHQAGCTFSFYPSQHKLGVNFHASRRFFWICVYWILWTGIYSFDLIACVRMASSPG